MSIFGEGNTSVRGENIETSPQSNTVVLKEGYTSIKITLRQNGKYIVGSLKEEVAYPFTGSLKATGFFYLWH
jgi:hypothetical protein